MTVLQNTSRLQFGGTTIVNKRDLQNAMGQNDNLRDKYYQIFKASDPNVRFKTTKEDANGLLKVQSWKVDDYGAKLSDDEQPEYTSLDTTLFKLLTSQDKVIGFARETKSNPITYKAIKHLLPNGSVNQDLEKQAYFDPDKRVDFVA